MRSIEKIESAMPDDADGLVIPRCVEADSHWPDLWLDDSNARKVEVMTEQVLLQRDGYALILLHAEITEDEDDPGDLNARWQPRF